MSTSSSLLFRAAVADDLPALVTLLNQLNHAEGNKALTDQVALGEALFGVNRRIDFRALLAVKSTHVVALALYYVGYDTLSASYGYHLADLVVEETHRRQKIAQKLFAHLAAQNLAEGGEWISLTVLQKNTAAQAFYKKLAMTEVPVKFFAVGAGILSELSALLQK